MKTLFLSGSDYHSAQEVHQALKTLLGLPDYYGMNADALNDCLSERGEPVRLWISDPGEGEAASTLKLISRVVTDNGGEAVILK